MSEISLFTIEIVGFESLVDLEENFFWKLSELEEEIIPAEFQGTMVIKVTYWPPEDGGEGVGHDEYE